MIRQAVILAGGKGTRLRERLGDLPKPLIDLCGTPLLERQIDLLKRNGFEHILILVNYQAGKIIDFCQSKGNWGLTIDCIDDGRPCGTAGAVLKVWDRLENTFLVIYGDTMLEVDLLRFQRFHDLDKNAAATLFVHPNDHPNDSDIVEVNGLGYITRFHSYPHDEGSYLPNLVNAALYIVQKSSLHIWRNTMNETLDFAKELFPNMLKNGFTLRAYNSTEYIKDCGTPHRIDKVASDLLCGKINRAALSQQQKAVFLDRDGTINVEIDHLTRPSQFELLPGVDQAIRRLNQAEYRTCVITNQPVIARGECTFSDLQIIHNKLETELGHHGAFVDRIYFCPHHPDAGFEGEISDLKIKCACRKPGVGMIETAIRELSVQPASSWLVGDTTTDLQTAHDAGLKSILVETGYAGLDQKYLVSPDFTVPDLPAAVALILDIYPKALTQARQIVAGSKAGGVILIGGQARTGKSSFASVIKDAVLERGLHAHIISTDRWLLDEAKREDGVAGRHAFNELKYLVHSFLDPLNRPTVLTLPAYQKKTKQQIVSAETKFINQSDIIIFEGVIALGMLSADKSHQRLFIELDESERYQRFMREYRLRGISLEAAFKLYENRMKDEVPYIRQTAAGATLIHSPFRTITMSKSQTE